ncbi:MAG: energy transducer TonB [Saprospiraceae bacterium]|nr:energy transducer TonB [Saprospiraceae bacterium]MDZ4705018.1 energy transducer TonB [Saprospiraceae bacterium]
MTTSILCIGGSPFFGFIEPALTFGQFCWIILTIGIGLFILPRVLKNRLGHLNQSPWLRSIRLRGVFLNLGLTISLGISVLAFSIVQPELADGNFSIEPYEPDYIEPEMPRTDFKKPLPPPPPPLQKLAVTEEVVEPPVFEDKSIDATSSVERPAALNVEPPSMPPPPPRAEEPDETPFRVVEQMPRFPGCEAFSGTNAEKQACATQKLLEFIYKNIKYPAAARDNGIQGTVVVSFVVEKDGKLTDAVVLRDIGGGCGTEALRVINLMNEKDLTWVPGKQRGRPVRVQFNLPVKYRLD